MMQQNKSMDTVTAASASAEQHSATDAVGAAASSNADSMQNGSAGRRTVGIVYDKVMEYHVREDHPEHPNRVRVLNERLREAGLLDRCIKLPSKLATDEALRTCHSQEHVDKVTSLYNSAPDMRTDEGELLRRIGDTFIITGDIYCNSNTNEAARSAAGCAVQAVEAVLSGQVESAFAVVRPPGHHAEPSDYMGFCFFNNVAVAAHAALKHPGIQRVLILDWDIHHGNGTQKVFWEDDRVLFVSLHRRDKDFYPEGIGFADEVGEGTGKGFNVNVPWSETKMGDADYMAAFELILEPIISEFDPQLVIISAGFDAAEGDFLGKCMVTPEGFGAMTSALMRHAGGKVVAVLEGGYVPSILGECAAAVLSRLLGDPAPPLPASVLGAVRSKTGAALAKVDEQHRRYWKRLAAQPPLESALKTYKTQHQLAALCIGGTRRSSGGAMVTRRQGGGAAAAGKTGSLDAGAAGGSNFMTATGGTPVPLAARAPALSSAGVAGRKQTAGVKPVGATAVPAAAAAAGVSPAMSSSATPATAPKRGKRAAVAKAGTTAPPGAAQAAAGGGTAAAAAAAAAPFTQAAAAEVQSAAGALPVPDAGSAGTAFMPAASIPGASVTAPAAAVSEPAAAMSAAVSAAASGTTGRKIRIKLAGKTPAAAAVVQQPVPVPAAEAAVQPRTEAQPSAEAQMPTAAGAEQAAGVGQAELLRAVTPELQQAQAQPEPSLLTNLTTPIVSSSISSNSSSQRVLADAAATAAAVAPTAAEAQATAVVSHQPAACVAGTPTATVAAVRPAATPSPTAVEARTAVIAAMPPSPVIQVATASPAAAAGMAAARPPASPAAGMVLAGSPQAARPAVPRPAAVANPPAVPDPAAAAAAAGAAATSAVEANPVVPPPVPSYAPAAAEALPPAAVAAAAGLAAPEEPPGPEAVAAAPVPLVPAAQAAASPLLPAAEAAAVDADMAMDDVLAPGTPAEHSMHWYAASHAAADAEGGEGGGEEDAWAAMESAQLQPATPSNVFGVDQLSADLLRLAVQEAAEVPLSP